MKRLPATITVTSREVIDYLQGCGVQAQARNSNSGNTYILNGNGVSLAKLVEIANDNRLENQLPPFALKV